MRGGLFYVCTGTGGGFPIVTDPDSPGMRPCPHLDSLYLI